jgi:hypothetical protein
MKAVSAAEKPQAGRSVNTEISGRQSIRMGTPTVPMPRLT